MAIYRQIQTLFWQDGFVLELTPEEKYFYFYLMTNPRTTQCGIFELPKKIAETETGYSRDTIDKLLNRFIDYGKILYCEETREIIILNWIKYNFINSRNTILCINKELKEVKNKPFINMLYKICLNKGYDAGAVFEGIILDSEEMDSKGEGKAAEINIEEIQHSKIADGCVSEQYTSENNIDHDENYDSSNEGNQDPYRGLEGAYIPLGEKEIKEKEEIKEEIYIQKASSNKQEVIDNNKKNNKQNKSAQNNPNRLLMEFDKNIRQAKVMDIEKMLLWLKEFEEEVIIQAILETVKYNAPHIGYLESVIQNWKALGLFTMEKLKAYRSKAAKATQKIRCNADAYKYLD